MCECHTMLRELTKSTAPQTTSSKTCVLCASVIYSDEINARLVRKCVFNSEPQHCNQIARYEAG